jgi:DNA-binding HxlR family transcriptional regulator
VQCRIDGITVVADQIDLQIMALIMRGLDTRKDIYSTMAARETSQFSETKGIVSVDTLRRHLKGLIEKSLVSGTVEGYSLTERGTEIISGLVQRPGGLDSYNPPHVEAICVYSPRISAPNLVLGSLVYLGNS